MNTDPKALTVLCYGDSNTWGQKPDKSGRYPADVRWTGRLQINLGDRFYIIEEGLSSRTTDLEYDKKPGRNGKTYLMPCLVSHSPLDVVVIMLGTNDLKLEFNRSSFDIAEALRGLAADVCEFGYNGERKPPKILLVSPIYVDNNQPDFAKLYDSVFYDAGSAAKSKELAGVIKAVADDNNYAFFDASTVAASGSDGIHFTAEAHAGLGEALAAQIRQIIA